MHGPGGVHDPGDGFRELVAQPARQVGPEPLREAPGAWVRLPDRSRGARGGRHRRPGGGPAGRVRRRGSRIAESRQSDQESGDEHETDPDLRSTRQAAAGRSRDRDRRRPLDREGTAAGKRDQPGQLVEVAGTLPGILLQAGPEDPGLGRLRWDASELELREGLLLGEGHQAAGLEGRTTLQQPEEAGTPGVPIAAGGGLVALQDLGSHDPEGPHHRPGAGQARLRVVERQSEIDQHHPAGVLQEDVPGLQVPVDQPRFMGRLEGVRHLEHEREGILGSGEPVQGLAPEQLGDEVGTRGDGPGVEDFEHPWVLDPGEQLAFAEEPPDHGLVATGRQDLDRHLPARGPVDAAEHRAHAALAQGHGIAEPGFEVGRESGAVGHRYLLPLPQDGLAARVRREGAVPGPPGRPP